MPGTFTLPTNASVMATWNEKGSKGSKLVSCRTPESARGRLTAGAEINIVIASIVIVTIRIMDLLISIVTVCKGLAALLELLSTTDYQQAGGSCFQRDFASSPVFTTENCTPIFV